MGNEAGDSDDNVIYVEDFIPIPRKLWSIETGRRFTHCIECNRALLVDGVSYLIEKAFHGREVIAEFAWCIECYDGLQKRFSRETRTRVWDFFLDHTDMVDRRAKLSRAHRCDWAAWTAKCLTCGRATTECQEQLYLGQCEGSHLLFYHLPYMLCDRCENAIIDLMSQASLDIWNDWIEQNLPPLPEAVEGPPSRRLLLV